MNASSVNNSDPSNKLRSKLYELGNKSYPDYVFEWFFRYFAGGVNQIKPQPRYLIDNFDSLISAAQIMIEHQYSKGNYAKIIHDNQTPHYNYYFVGDTHGSFQDTYSMIDYFIKVFQVHPFTKIVWLGDIVDRNPYDLENLAFILSFWLLFPENVFIIRGNHEDSSVCSRYGFSQNLYERIGDRAKFDNIWNKTMAFFKKLPLGYHASIGEKEIIAFHAGFPFDLNNYSVVDLNTIEKDLDCFHEEHFDMDAYSQSILWSDPDPFNLEQKPVAPTPRTGRPRFNEDALTDFLNKNNFDALVRGHQKFEMGYNLLWNNRVISIFSTSKYDDRPIGQAKFLRIRPDTQLNEIEDEQKGLGKGILAVDPKFLELQLNKIYHAESN